MRKVFPLILSLVIVIIMVYSFSGGDTTEDYIQEIKEDRESKQSFMASNSASPFRKGEIPFDSLRYFPPNPEYRVKATLSPVTMNKLMQLPTTTGEQEKFIKHSTAEFTIDGVPCRALLLESGELAAPKQLFLFFVDETSTRSTYGGGRYLDVDYPEGNTVTLDFNKAYNPYCAYNETYSCPVPPRQNNLPVAIKAGEKKYFTEGY